MIQVHIAGLQLFSKKLGFVLLLRGSEDKRTLPIFIGAAEAQSIAIHLSQTNTPRPLSHDLMKNILETMGCRLKAVQIHTLAENTFYARLIIERTDGELELDARPSDAIALGLRCQAPIFVAQAVMDQAGILLAEGNAAKAQDAKQTPAGKSPDKQTSPIEALKQQMDKAVAEERYEDAARIRDEIRRLDQSHN